MRLLIGALLLFTGLNAWAQVPGVTWATGGSVPGKNYGRQAQGNGVATDAAGNTYVTGIFRDTLTLGSTRLISTGDYDVYVAKLNAAGQYQWAAQAGGSAWDISNGVALDASGNVYITGYTESAAPSFGSFSLTNPSYGAAVFVAKLSPAGAWLRVSSASAPGDTYSVSTALAVDAGGNVYITGGLRGAVQFGATTLPLYGGYAVFVAKLSAAGTWEWATASWGGYNFGNAIALDSAGNPYITGSFEANTVQFGSFTLTKVGFGGQAFVAKLDAAGHWLWATQGRSRWGDAGRGIVLDAAGNAYVTGNVAGTTAQFGTLTLNKPDDSLDLFVAKLDPAGIWQWVVQGGGPGADGGTSICLNQAGNLTIIGTANSPTASFGALPGLNTLGKNDIVVAQLDAAGHWRWVLNTGGPGADYGIALAQAPQEEVRITGTFDGPSITLGATTLPGGTKQYEAYADCHFVASVADLAQRSPAGLTLWPNPSAGTVYATGLEAGQPVQVFDSRGRLVAADARPAYEAQGLALPTLAAGLYIVRCGTQSKQVVIY